jgi:hypothetical protein
MAIEKMHRESVKALERPDLVADTGLTLQGLVVWEYAPTGERWTHPDWRRTPLRMDAGSES